MEMTLMGCHHQLVSDFYVLKTFISCKRWLKEGNVFLTQFLSGKVALLFEPAFLSAIAAILFRNRQPRELTQVVFQC